MHLDFALKIRLGDFFERRRDVGLYVILNNRISNN